jgi:hypothetical protein
VREYRNAVAPFHEGISIYAVDGGGIGGLAVHFIDVENAGSLDLAKEGRDQELVEMVEETDAYSEHVGSRRMDGVVRVHKGGIDEIEVVEEDINVALDVGGRRGEQCGDAAPRYALSTRHTGRT